MLIGKRLQELRATKNISQTQLAQLLGVSKVSVCGYESGKRIPSLPMLIKLADVFDVSVDTLLGREIKLVAEDTPLYQCVVAKEEFLFLKELRENPSIHVKVLRNPQRSIKILKYYQTN